ncbi:MAG: sulfatase [Woeseiaceae bacterium]
MLVIADDVSWNDIGAYGHPTIRTPVLDELAANGVRFDNAYLTTSSCSPSRASILTGRYPHNTDAEQLHWPLPAEQLTFSEVLREAGYWTAAAGKWHLGPEVLDRFDVVYESTWSVGDEVTPSGTEDWLRLLDERPRDKPFFMWLAAWDAHRPYDDDIIDEPHTQDDVRLPPYYPATEQYLDDFASYYDEIARLDQVIGDVVRKLESQGVAENTVIVFIADNGRPYARDKATLYDSGVKTPLIVYWPNRVAAGGVSHGIVSAVDIAPTILELAGAPKPDSIEGRSFVELLSEPQNKFRSYAASERNWHDFEDHGRSVRTARYRYIRNNYPDLPATPSGDTVYHGTWRELLRLYKSGNLTADQSRPFRTPRPEEELYDIHSDPYELINLAGDAEFFAILEQHRAALAAWTEETDDFIPSVRTPDEFDRETGARLPARIRPRPSKKEMFDASGSY